MESKESIQTTQRLGRQSRLSPLNDFAFKTALGEDGREAPLAAFLGSVLTESGRKPVKSIEFLDKDLPPDLSGGKLGRLDVLARLEDGSRVNIEVQLKNEYNIEKRTLCYWSRLYTSEFKEGADYATLLPVITINIINFDYIDSDDFHTVFHLREDKKTELMLTDVCEIHFLNMVKFRKLREGQQGFDLNNPLHRWLAFFDDNSPKELVEEVIKMDNFIHATAEQMERIQRDPALMHAYDNYWKAASDWTSGINGAKREEQYTIARNLKNMGLSPEQIAKATNLSLANIQTL
jgi:predicted transposase/invertase (TIGR01784 family)